MSENKRRNEYGRTVSGERKASARSASSGRVTARKSAPKTSSRQMTRQTDDRSLVQIVRDRSLAKRRERDEKWDAKDIQRVRHGVDKPMLVIILVLLVLGTVMVFSASYPNALRMENDSLYYIRNQLLFVVLGGVAMFGASLVPLKWYKKATPSVALFSLGLLLLVLVIGTAEGVARRWIMVGPISVQPSEVAKLALVMTLAYHVDRRFDEIHNRRDKLMSFVHGILIPGVILMLFCGLVLMEKHLSGTVILGLIGVAVIFVSGVDILKMGVCYGVPALGVVAVYLATNSYALQRITTHSDENADVLGEAWQTTQGLYAIGSGGLLGLGLGESNLKYNYVSAAHNDFIFTIWCEEMGFVGAVILVVLYGIFVWRGLLIAKKAPDTFSSLVAFGITFQVGIQAVLNIMVVTDILPNTGVSLPFFSYGGSALVMLLGEMGILLAISKHSYQKK